MGLYIPNFSSKIVKESNILFIKQVDMVGLF